MNDMRANAWSQGPEVFQALPRPLPHEALAGVRSRRILAIGLDLIIVGVLAIMLWLLLGILTLGLALFLVPLPFAIVGFFYNGLTVSGWRMSTPGMHAMDLEMRLSDGGRVPFINAAVHAMLFYISWFFPLVLLISLLDGEKRLLHDMLCGVVVIRRPAP